MLRKIGLSILSVGLLCLAAFQVIGSEIDENGFLREPFALIPIGLSLTAIGLVITAIGVAAKAIILMRSKYKKTAKNDSDPAA